MLTKNIILSLLLVTSTALARDYNHDDDNHHDYHQKDSYIADRDKNFYYWKLGAANIDLDHGPTFIPLMGFGRRSQTSDYAIDFSVAWGKKASDTTTSYFSLPRFNFVAFTHPKAASSFFYGGGLSWTTLRSDHSKFTGVFGELTAGYEMNRRAHFKPVIEVSLIQPLIAETKRGCTPGLSFITSVSFVF